jgi:hypothetical protein
VCTRTEWWRGLGLSLLDALLEKAPSGYEQWQLLSLAAQASTAVPPITVNLVDDPVLTWLSPPPVCEDVSEEYKRLHKHFGILRSAGLPFRMLKGKREDVVHALLAGGHFALAREFVSDVRHVLLCLEHIPHAFLSKLTATSS